VHRTKGLKYGGRIAPRALPFKLRLLRRIDGCNRPSKTVADEIVAFSKLMSRPCEGRWSICSRTPAASVDVISSGMGPEAVSGEEALRVTTGTVMISNKSGGAGHVLGSKRTTKPHA
jgi:hypothetical protein